MSIERRYALIKHEHTAGGINSGSATDGHVLTADGAGGAVWEAQTGGGGGGVTDHGALTGLGDDDHTQYLNSTRHAAIDAADHGSGAAVTGKVLMADGAGGAGWNDPPAGSVLGAMEFVASASVTGSAATSLQVTGLDLDAHGIYYLVIRLKNATAAQNVLSLFYNADTTSGNYNSSITSLGSSTQSNSAQITGTFGSVSCELLIYMTISRANTRVVGTCTPALTSDSGTNIRSQIATHEWSTTGVNVTSITLSGSVANNIDVGTSLTVYKLAQSAASYQPISEVQAADLVITSNITYQDTDLVIPLVPGTYSVEAYYTTTVNTTPNMLARLDYTGTTSSCILRRFAMRGTIVGEDAYDALPAEYLMNETASYRVLLSGVIVVSTSGNLRIQAAQENSSATSVTFKAGGVLKVTRLL